MYFGMGVRPEIQILKALYHSLLKNVTKNLLGNKKKLLPFCLFYHKNSLMLQSCALVKIAVKKD